MISVSASVLEITMGKFSSNYMLSSTTSSEAAPQVFQEARLLDNLVRLHVELLDDELLYMIVDNYCHN